MKQSDNLNLGRRERQIMEIVYARGSVSVTEVLEALPDPPSYSAVRAMLNFLKEKGHLRHKQVGRKFVYLPTVSHSKASNSALRKLLATFFSGSPVQAVASLLELEKEKLAPEDFDRLAQLIETARKEGQ